MPIEARLCARCKRPVHKGKCVGSSRFPVLRADRGLEAVQLFRLPSPIRVNQCLGDRACPHPPYVQGLCRGHLRDRMSEGSLLGSTLGGAAHDHR